MRDLLKEFDSPTRDNPMVVTSDIIDELTNLLRRRNAVPPKRSFYVQGDYVPGGEIKSMADGKIYDSKSKYYQSVKDAGLVVVGTDKIKQKREADTVTERDVKQAIDILKSR